MPSLGNLYVTLGAKTDGLDQGIHNAKKSLNDLSGVAANTIKNIGLLGAAAIGAGAGIVTGLVTSGLKAIDTQAKLSQALDGTIGGLRAAEMAAGDAGVATEEFYSAATRMNAALGDATKQAGPAYDALTNLGLSAEKLLSLDIDQRFAAIADAMAKQNVSGAQAQDIMRDLGVRSQNLSNLIRQGGEAFREQAAEVDRLGLRLSMVDAAKVEMANDAMGVFGDVLTGVQDRLTVTAAPYLTVLSEKFREAAVESGGFKDQTKSVIDAIINGFGFAADAVHGLQVVLKGLQVAYYAVKAAIVSGFEASFKFAEVGVWASNKVIDALNLLGADIDNLPPISESPFAKSLRGMAQEARDSVSAASGELSALAMQEMPSEKVKQYLDEVAKASTEAAAKVVSARKSMVGGGETALVDTGNKEDQDKFSKDMAAWIQQQNAQVEAIKERYMTEEQLEAEHREVMAVIGSEFDAAKFESEAQWRSIREQAEAEHLQRMTDMNRSAYEGIQNLIATRWGNAVASTAGAMKSILGTMATGSRKAFEASKAWAMADALISTYQGIAKGVALGFPAAIPAVAWAAANGFAQVSAIKNQSFGGAGGAAAAGNGTPATAPNPIGVGGSTGQGGANQNQTLTVAPIDPNALYSGSSMQSLGNQIYNFSKDGGKVIFQA